MQLSTDPVIDRDGGLVPRNEEGVWGRHAGRACANNRSSRPGIAPLDADAANVAALRRVLAVREMKMDRQCQVVLPTKYTADCHSTLGSVSLLAQAALQFPAIAQARDCDEVEILAVRIAFRYERDLA
jgi:hypothetical protein